MYDWYKKQLEAAKDVSALQEICEIRAIAALPIDPGASGEHQRVCLLFRAHTFFLKQPDDPRLPEALPERFIQRVLLALPWGPAALIRKKYIRYGFKSSGHRKS